MSEFRMPSLGADMEAGTLVEWLVKPGDTVKRGDIIAVVDTQKGAIEIEVFESGVLQQTLVEVGTQVPVGTPLALITAPGAAPAAAPAPEQPAPATAAKAAEAPLPPPPEPAPPVREQAAPPLPAGQERLRASPAARRLAAQSGLDLSILTGTGPDGTIVLADVAARIGKKQEPPAPAPAKKPSPLSGMRAAIAAAMAHSKREIPHYYLAHTIDLSAAQDWLTAHNEGKAPSERLLMGALFVKAVARAVKKFPEFNGHFVEGAYEPSPVVHVGVAVNIRGGGLVAPAIHDTDTLELDAVMAGMRDLVARVRAGKFRSSEIADPTITVSSLGERGVEVLYGVIYPPQVAILGFGMPVMRPWAVNGMIGAHQIVTVTLAGDHRVSDGHRGALFLNAIERQLMEPEAL